MKLSSIHSPLPLLSLFDDIQSPTECAHKLHDPLKHHLIEQFGIANMTAVPQNSTEYHKQATHKEYVRTLLVGLLPTKGEQVVYTEEVQFCLPEGAKGPHGMLVLMIGKRAYNDHILTLCQPTQHHLPLKEVVFSETTPLKSDTTELGVTAQAAIELLFVSQIMKQENSPKLLFVANRVFIRPFLYLKNVDILLTTKKAFEWRTQDLLLVEGVCAVALLLQGDSYLQGLGNCLQDKVRKGLVDLREYGRELTTWMSEAWELARKNVGRVQKKQKQYYDQRQRPPNFRVGDRAFLFMPAEKTGQARNFARPYRGPYQILEVDVNTAQTLVMKSVLFSCSMPQYTCVQSYAQSHCCQ